MCVCDFCFKLTARSSMEYVVLKSTITGESVLSLYNLKESVTPS